MQKSPGSAGGAVDCRVRRLSQHRGRSPGDAGAALSFPLGGPLLLGELGAGKVRREGPAPERVPCWPLLSLWLPRVGRVRAEMGPHWVRSEGDPLALGAISTVSKVSFGEKTGKCWRLHGRWFHGCFTPRRTNRVFTVPVSTGSSSITASVRNGRDRPSPTRRMTRPQSQSLPFLQIRSRAGASPLGALLCGCSWSRTSGSGMGNLTVATYRSSYWGKREKPDRRLTLPPATHGIKVVNEFYQ